MIELNLFYLQSYVMVNKFFQKNHINYYPTSVGAAYKELFHRDSFACLSFYDKHNVQYYMYFNAAYNSDINRMVFSSITIVPRENLNKHLAVHHSKVHVETQEDLETLFNILKGMI